MTKGRPPNRHAPGIMLDAPLEGGSVGGFTRAQFTVSIGSRGLELPRSGQSFCAELGFEFGARVVGGIFVRSLGSGVWSQGTQACLAWGAPVAILALAA
jgi:hypothetical protein